MSETTQALTKNRENIHIKRIYAYRDAMQDKLHKEHPFFKWARSNKASTEQKLEILPAMTVFVMNFRDMNQWVIRFTDPDNLFKEVINGSTTEDATHSKLFLEDWRKLHFDDKLGWKPSDVMWWLFLSPDMEPFRRYGVEFMKLCVEDKNDVFVRFAHSEAGEACGNVFFKHISPLAEQLGKKRNLNYRYFGMFHLDLETGHVLESEKLFRDQWLTQEQADLGLELSKRMFNIFDRIHDAFLDYVKRYVEKGRVPQKILPWQATNITNTEVSKGVGSANYCVAGNSQGFVHQDQQQLEAHLLHRKEIVAKHPFYKWLHSANLPAIKRLQRFIPLWSVDIFGYRDLNKYVFKYEPPNNELEESVNAVAREVGLHSQLFLNDWVNLGLDEVLRWPASDTLDFIFFDYFMDQHRKTMINFGLIGLKHQDAFERLWFMEALESSGHAFFSNVKQVALQAEQDEGIRLDYLADRHYLVHPDNGGHTERVNFKALPLQDEAQKQPIYNFIDTVFDALERNLKLSLLAAQENKLSG